MTGLEINPESFGPSLQVIEQLVEPVSKLLQPIKMTGLNGCAVGNCLLNRLNVVLIEPIYDEREFLASSEKFCK